MMVNGRHADKRDKGIGAFSSMEKTLDAHPRILFASALALISVVSFFIGSYYDNDQWFTLANGRYIVEHGFPYTDVFHSWGGGTVIENWLWSVLMWTGWHLAGDRQIGIWLVALSAVLATSSASWFIARNASRTGCPTISVTSMILTGLFLDSAYSMRPALASVMCSSLSLLMVIRYIRTRKPRYLALMVPIMLVSFNMHMAMGWYVILVPGCMMLADVIITSKDRMRNLIGYAITVACSVVVTLVNPWFVDGSMFLARSYGVAKYGNNIIELVSLFQCSGNVECIITMFDTIVSGIIAATLAAIALFVNMLIPPKARTSESRIMTIGASVMFLGFCIATVGAVRSISDFVIMLPMATVLLLDRICLPPVKDIALVAAVIALVMFAVVAGPDRIYPSPTDYGTSLYDMRNERLQFSNMIKRRYGDSVRDLQVLGEYGGRLTYLGYHVSDDMRPEMTDSALNGLGYNPHKEIIDAIWDESGKSAREYVDKYKGRFQLWQVHTEGQMDKVISKDAGDFRLVQKNDRDGWTLYESIPAMENVRAEGTTAGRG